MKRVALTFVCGAVVGYVARSLAGRTFRLITRGLRHLRPDLSIVPLLASHVPPARLCGRASVVDEGLDVALEFTSECVILAPRDLNEDPIQLARRMLQEQCNATGHAVCTWCGMVNDDNNGPPAILLPVPDARVGGAEEE